MHSFLSQWFSLLRSFYVRSYVSLKIGKSSGAFMVTACPPLLSVHELRSLLDAIFFPFATSQAKMSSDCCCCFYSATVHKLMSFSYSAIFPWSRVKISSFSIATHLRVHSSRVHVLGNVLGRCFFNLWKAQVLKHFWSMLHMRKAHELAIWNFYAAFFHKADITPRDSPVDAAHKLRSCSNRCSS